MVMQMRHTRRNWAPFLVSASLLLAPLHAQTFAMSAAVTNNMAIVVHPSVTVDNVSARDLGRLLLGERRFWQDRLRVKLLVRAPKSTERDVYVKAVCQMTEPQFRQYWIGMVFRGRATSSPKVTYSNRMAYQLARAIPGALAILPIRDVGPGVKVLKVNGKRPGEAGYRLR